MAPHCRDRPDLEKRIPKSLKNVERKCPRPKCGSKDVVLRYFNNDKDDQPRFFCYACTELFTLGGTLRKPYNKGKSKTGKAKARVKANNLQAQGAEIGEGSRLASRTQTRTRSSRFGLAQTTGRVGIGIEVKATAIEVSKDEEETDYSDEEEEGSEIEMKDIDEDGSEDKDEDESEEEDGKAHPLDLNQLPHRESNVAREDEEMDQEEEIEGRGDSRLPREGNEDGVPMDEVREFTEETPTEVDTSLREGLHLGGLSTEQLRLEAKMHLVIAQRIIEDVVVERSTIEMELECQEMKRCQELEKRKVCPVEDLQYRMKEGFVGYMSPWVESPLNQARYEMLVAQEASLEKDGQTIKSFALKVDEMQNKYVPHATMVAFEKDAKQLKDRVVALTN